MVNRDMEKVDITRSLQMLVGEHDVIDKCGNCNSKHISYLGLGEYKCADCGASTFNTYGIVRACIDGHDEPLTISEVIAYTGLRKMDIRRLLRDGSIILTANGIQIPIK